MPPALLPAALTEVWRVFEELRATQDPGFSLAPISHEEIQAFQHNRSIRLTSFEVTAVLTLDGIFRKVMNTDGSGKDRH